MATNLPVTPDTMITIKVSIEGGNRKFKVPLKDLTASTLPNKLRFLLAIPANQEVVFERFSDSAGSYITLDASNQHVYKTLFRAAKAKLKLRLRATVTPETVAQETVASEMVETPAPAQQGSGVALPRPVTTEPMIVSSRYDGDTRTLPNTRLPGFSELAARLAIAPECKYAPAAIASARQYAPAATADRIPPPLCDAFMAELANDGCHRDLVRDLAFRMRDYPQPYDSSWKVFCNACDSPMANVHFHCSTCDNGDYDLCQSCVDDGKTCPGEDHWLIKRFIQNGKVVSSSTDRIASKTKHEAKQDMEKEMPGAFTQESKVEVEEDDQLTRTCNSCIKELPESNFVTCSSCEDYDLCVPCHIGTKHGHHPGHAFIKATEKTDVRGQLADFLMAPGRNTVVDLKPTEETSVKSGETSKKTVSPSYTPFNLQPPCVPEVLKELLEPVKPKQTKLEKTSKAEAPQQNATPSLDAHFIRDTIPDGAKLQPEERFTQVWTLRNPGPHDWPAGCSVRYVGGDNMLNVNHTHPSSVTDIADATESNVVGRPVAEGEEIAFRVLMKAPQREGKAISYWRLKTADGIPFGHRLWCDIDVAVAQVDALATVSTPAIESEQTALPTVEHIEFFRPAPSGPSGRSADLIQWLDSYKTTQAQKQDEVSKTEPLPSSVFNFEVRDDNESKEVYASGTTRKEDLEGSAMIFPTLDKESPVSSTYQSATAGPSTSSTPSKGKAPSLQAFVRDEAAEEAAAAHSAVEVPVETVAAATQEDDDEKFEDLTDDLELLSAIEDESVDDGFDTDDEYDILDASDEDASFKAGKSGTLTK
ncbi:hypothetical protein B0A49_05112 [Cryomyces minteri]|uniref:ZZ-type domain-containing protein n=1 Tax=Cryomyces minteri TaxID=331657 RepID=A0A4U0XDL0_9PEZI|nr:hypothetical protein B0A49_05112 [Cryomyces minteri]